MLLVKLRGIGMGALACASFLWTSNPALGDTQLAAVRRPFSTAQWNELMQLRHSAIVLPANIPSGYRVVAVRVQRNTLQLGGESYDIVYSDGTNAIEWYVSNTEAGGDAPPESFRAQYDSKVLGHGVIVSQDNVDDPLSGRPRSCWLTGTPVANLIAGETYGMTACGSAISAQSIAGAMSSMYLVSNRAPHAINNIWPESMEKKEWLEWTLVKSGNRYILDSYSTAEVDDPCSGHENFPSNDARVAAVRTYYEDWDDNRLGEAWSMLSASYHHLHNESAWVADHKSVRDIGAVTLCPLSANSVAAWIWWVDK